MTDFEKGVLAGLTTLIVVVLLGIFTDWGAMGDPVRIPLDIRPMQPLDPIELRPSRPPHPIQIYTPPGRHP